jgi:hypothetical protein
VQELSQRPLISGHDEEHTGERLRLHDLKASLGVTISRAHGPRALFKGLVPRGARARMVEQALSLTPLFSNRSLVVPAAQMHEQPADQHASGERIQGKEEVRIHGGLGG